MPKKPNRALKVGRIANLQLGPFGDHGMSDDSIVFSRKPYFITYRSIHDGEMKRIRRVPPEKIHEALPTDVVELTSKKNDDFQAGESFEVKHINPRHPNVLQLVNDEGQTTFVEHFNTELKEEVAPRWEDGKLIEPRDRPQRNRYLLWP